MLFEFFWLAGVVIDRFLFKFLHLNDNLNSDNVSKTGTKIVKLFSSVLYLTFACPNDFRIIVLILHEVEHTTNLFKATFVCNIPKAAGQYTCAT